MAAVPTLTPGKNGRQKFGMLGGVQKLVQTLKVFLGIF